ncbi:hypothetical protein [Aliagarivorans marinus]|uniref:hypothetical protein n=1 Tax=Aliagarivorans marinus TaxID=561965 RepID=UPI000423EA1A|nr:hypothetical protein [Aliagarivorans marinus]
MCALLLLFSFFVTGDELAITVECPNWGDYRHLSEFDIPATQLVQQVFDCSHVSEYITDLDQLDRDLLFLRAAKSDWDTLVGYRTQTEPQIPYLELIPETSLRALQQNLRPATSKPPTSGPQSQPCD